MIGFPEGFTLFFGPIGPLRGVFHNFPTFPWWFGSPWGGVNGPVRFAEDYPRSDRQHSHAAAKEKLMGAVWKVVVHPGIGVKTLQHCWCVLVLKVILHILRCAIPSALLKPEVLTLLASVGLHGALRLRLPQIQARHWGCFWQWIDSRQLVRILATGKALLEALLQDPTGFPCCHRFSKVSNPWEWKHLEECAPIWHASRIVGTLQWNRHKST